MSSKNSISQWTGVIIACIALPFVGTGSAILSAAAMAYWGIDSLVLTGLMIVVIAGTVTFLIAKIVSILIRLIIS